MSYSILLVDDDRTTLTLYSRFLKKTGLDVDTADSVSEALDLAASGKYDLICLDYYLGPDTGSQLIAELRDRFPGGRPLLVLLSGEEDALRKCGLDQPDAFFQKPLRPRDLVRNILTLIEDQRVEADEENGTSARELPTKLTDSGLQPLILPFLENRLSSLKIARNSLQRDSFEPAFFFGHKLYGTGASFGFQDLTDLGGELEEAAKARDKKKALLLFNTIEVLLEQYLVEERARGES